MGRGRAKAKQTKVARELKYSSGALDAEALRRELAGQGPGALTTKPDDAFSDEFEDAFSDDYGDVDTDEEDEGED